MKKRILSLLTAACLMLTLAPAAFATDGADDLQAQIIAAEVGSTITLTGNVTLTSPLTIDKAITIDGTASKYAINYTGTSTSEAAVQVTTSGQVTLQNLIVNATNVNGRAVKLVGSSTCVNFTLSNSVMNVGNRGIWFDNNCCNSNSTITVSDSVIQNSQLPEGENYDTWAPNADVRGLSLWDLNGAHVVIADSTIQGFGYAINIAGTQGAAGARDANGAVIDITNSNIKGWSALNVWAVNTTYHITNSNLIGVNCSTYSAHSFATIALNDGMYGTSPLTRKPNTFNISGGSIYAYTWNDGTATDVAIRVEKERTTKFNFSSGADGKPVVIYVANYLVPYVFYSITCTADELRSYVASSKVQGTDNCYAFTVKNGTETEISLAPPVSNTLAELEADEPINIFMSCGGDSI